MRRLTLELTPRAEAGGVSLVRDDALGAADQAYDGCRSASGVERPVRPHPCGAGRPRQWSRPTRPPACGAAAAERGSCARHVPRAQRTGGNCDAAASWDRGTRSLMGALPRRRGDAGGTGCVNRVRGRHSAAVKNALARRRLQLPVSGQTSACSGALVTRLPKRASMAGGVLVWA